MAFAEYPVVSSSGSGGITKVADSIERNALTPADGDIVIQLDNDFLYEWNGSSWAVLADRTWQTAGSILGAKTFDTASRWSVATNQQVFGVTNTTTVNYAAPSANRVYTVPDVGADADYVLTAGNQTIGGTKTFSSAVVITPTTNQLVLGVTNTTTINSVAPSASRVYTIPDAGADASFVLTAGTQSVGGSKTFTSAVTVSASSNQIILYSGVNQLTLNSGTSAAARTYTVPDTGTTDTFAMLGGTQSFTGAKTFSSTITATNSSAPLTLNVGSSSNAELLFTSSATQPDLYINFRSTGTGPQSWLLGLNPSGISSNAFGLWDNTAGAPIFTIEQTTNVTTYYANVTINNASNQLSLSSSVNLLNLNSGTSAAARTYTFPDVGTTGTFAMLQGSQTFTGLKTFSSGLAVSGGSAANNTIWVASNVLNIRGGTSGTDIYNTSGNVVVDITDGGIVTLNPTTGLGTGAAAYNLAYGSLVLRNGTNARGVVSSNDVFIAGANVYRDGAGALKATSTQTGYTFFEMTRNGTAFDLQVSSAAQTADTAITTATSIFSASLAGAVTLGNSTVTGLTHQLIGCNAINIGDSGTVDFRNRAGTTTFMSVLTSTGAVTLGPTTGGALTHTAQSNGATTFSLTSSATNANCLSEINGKGTGRAYVIFRNNGTLKQEISVDSSGVLRIDDNVTEFASMSATGAWNFPVGPVLIGASGTGSRRLDVRDNPGAVGTSVVVFDILTNTTSGQKIVQFTRGSVGTELGTITRNGTTDAVIYSTTSDENLKKDFQDFDGLALAELIDVFDFAWKSNNERNYGYKAQQVYKYVPNGVVVPGDQNSPWSMDKSGLVPILHKAIKELNSKLKAMEKTLNGANT